MSFDAYSSSATASSATATPGEASLPFRVRPEPWHPPYNPYVFDGPEHHRDWVDYCICWRVPFWCVKPERVYDLRAIQVATQNQPRAATPCRNLLQFDKKVMKMNMKTDKKAERWNHGAGIEKKMTDGVEPGNQNWEWYFLILSHDLVSWGRSCKLLVYRELNHGPLQSPFN